MDLYVTGSGVFLHEKLKATIHSVNTDLTKLLLTE